MRNTFLLGLIVSLFSFQSLARDLVFTLKCEVDEGEKLPKGIEGYQVLKIAYKLKKPIKSGKRTVSWGQRYALEVLKKDGESEQIPFVSGGSGDEDYNEYDLKPSKSRKSVGVSGASIQNAFLWANLVNDDGSGFARCSPDVGQEALATIEAKNQKDKLVKLSLDSEGTPRRSDEPKTYPTIKDFREDADLAEACYRGEAKEAVKLVEALVSAADGDGDSYSELSSTKVTKSGRIDVEVEITDEGGKHEEQFSFEPCK